MAKKISEKNKMNIYILFIFVIKIYYTKYFKNDVFKIEYEAQNIFIDKKVNGEWFIFNNDEAKEIKSFLESR